MSEASQSIPRNLEIELGLHDVQTLSSADAVAAFFALLRYNTDSHTPQTPANLGITAEGTARPIKKIELIADQEGFFQVYLFELTNVTVAHTRALTRVFRNRAGNYLLVLTSDYEHLDFVLLEKYLPAESDNGSTIAPKQVGIRPRVLIVERRKPTRLQLRVLRRFTWTESDPFAQHDKLLSAYAVADWSEEFFNNRALFSDYYLLERLRERLEGSEDPKPAYVRLRQLYEGAASQFAGKEEGVLRQELLEPTLQVLGFEARPGKKSGSSAAEPDYRLYSPGRTQGSPLRALCLVYPWGRFLDGKDDQRDKETPDENPGAVVVSLLESGEAPWVLITNGKIWRLYAQRTHSRATNYYEIDLEEVLAQAGPHTADPAEAFRYFWLLFRCQAFEPVALPKGDAVSSALTFLDYILTESEEYAKKLGERLKERVFEEVFPHLAAGFIAYIQSVGARRAVPLQQNELDTIFQGTLTLLYRLLFLLYAEARDLLPVKEVRGYFEASLTKLKREIAEVAGSIADEVEERLKKHYRDDRYELYERLAHLFQVVDKGDPALNVPVYNGGLFLSDPEDQDESPEARVAKFLNTTKVPDRFLARALDLLARDVDPKRHDLAFIDYKSLGVRQLGSIYEGLLEFKLRIADHKLAIVKEKGHEMYVSFSDLDEKERERADRQGRVVKKGQVYLENDKRERKATGSYYTPDYIVKYIVEHAVGPVLQEKFEAMRPKLRDAQQRRRAFFQKQEALRKQRLKPEPEGKADFIGQELVDDLFDIKVLDPAMGSGHFLVEAVDYITDKALDFLNAFPWNPVVAHLTRMRETILREMDEQGITIDAKRLTDVNLLKRQVLKRCIYGVDLNPMAVELAKVSLWLDCFTLGAPLSFLDHHLRCGNSLIGVTVKEVREALEGKADEAFQFDLFGSRFAGLLLATDLMRHVGEISDVTSAQVQESRAEYRKASDALAPFKRILDTYTSQWFANENGNVGARRRRAQSDPPSLAFLKAREAEAFINVRDDKALRQVLDTLSPQDLRIAETVLTAAAEKRFFHWELEFPEVFYGPRPGSTQLIERLEGAGFDAVVGNPPYDELSEHALGRKLDEAEFFECEPIYAPAGGGRLNWYHFFILRSVTMLQAKGCHGFIVPMSLLADQFTRSLRKWLLESNQLLRVEAFPQKDDPANRVFRDAKLPTCLYIVERSKPERHFNVRVHLGKDILENSPSYRGDLQTLAALDPNNLTIPLVPQGGWHILKHVTQSERIGKMHEFGAAPASGEIVFNESFRRYLTEDPKETLILRGSHVQRWEIVDEAKQGEPMYLKKASYLKNARRDSKAFHFEKPRVVYQECAAIDNWRRVIAAYLPAGNFCGHKICYFTDYKCSPMALLAVFNSKFVDWLVTVVSTNNSLPAYLVGSIPFPKFVSSTPDAERRQQVGQLLELYKHGNKGGDAFAQLIASVGDPGGSLRIPTDVLHDLLAYLAERMIELNKQKQAESKLFLGWLEKELRIQLDKNGNAGIEALTGKTMLKNYLGDYQKGEEHTPIETLWEVLRRNIRRLGRSLDLPFEQRMRQEHEKSLALLLPIKQKLAATDWLIDQLVHRLYGLTEEEIAIVEGRG